MILHPFCLRCAALAGLCVLFSGCAGTGGHRGVPVWVENATAIEQEFSRGRYFIGRGVCGGAGPGDVMSRKQAEAAAVADIASVVEVQINDTIEDHDTSVERNGRLLEQSVRIQTTKRVVTGILSGVEIKHTFYDERSMNWHALAVLDRARAGAGAAEAVAQRVTRGRDVLAALGQGPVHDFIALRRLDRMTTELDRLAVALAIFDPTRKAAAKTQIEALKSDSATQRQTAQDDARVRILLRANDGSALPVSLRQAAAKALQQAGFTVVDAAAAGELAVSVQIQTATQVGSMTVYEVTSGAQFALRERDQVVMEGAVPLDKERAIRSSSALLSRSRSLDRLAERLKAGVTAMLDEA